MQKILEQYGRSASVKGLMKALALAQREGGREVHLRGATGSAAAVVLASVMNEWAKAQRGETLLMVMDDADDAGYMYSDLVHLVGDGGVLFFPSSYRREVRFGQRDAANEILRTAALARLTDREGATAPLAVVTHPSAMAELVVAGEERTDNTLVVRQGEELGLPFLERRLTDMQFTRTDYVYEPGQFAVRGSIVDVFSFWAERPLRIDFFDDEVDSIRTFDVQSQLSNAQLKEATIVPNLRPESQGRAGQCLLTAIPPHTILVAKDRLTACGKVRQVWDQGFSRQAEKEGKTFVKEDLLTDPDEFQRLIPEFTTLTIGHKAATPDATALSLATEPQQLFHKNFDMLIQFLTQLKADGCKTCVLADSQKQNERLRDILAGKAPGLTFRPVEGTLHEGYVDRSLKLALLTDHQIFGRFHRYHLKSDEARTGKVSLTLKELQQIKVGDYVVHIDHGVGQFGGLVRIPERGVMLEKVKIIYQGGDTVYVSLHALHKVSKYKGQDGQPPKINKLGTGAWERLKERTKRKIKDIAKDLIALYSKRMGEKGFAYSPDGYLQHELEASFLYEDTQDQRLATEAVKADMQKPTPMDRLVCGDVGFGKTEVAIRAAFKACQDGKQVAVLVPTTVLAFQHYRTLSDRLKNFPVKVDYLSRAKSTKQTREILDSLERGETDIIVGTHKLVGKTVKFKDLGLLIIDEEQKFGVATKEKLRQMRTNVDTLTLTATPIPRTLQFSLMGARDMSVIQTPPPNRQPIDTQVITFEPELIAEAINFEMSRGGQVYFVNNRISNLPELKDLINKYVPDARVAVGHGRMAPDEMERIVMDFVNHDSDVLLSTSIIENGIDIPNANTIIINGAHMFGLSDLHQMRGRVGRSNMKAFCYLIAPPPMALTPEARRRLEAIETFSSLGSGINIAMQDLDIRGAGNLLGAEQSGFIADLGYEAYQNILAEAMRELKETMPDAPEMDYIAECQVESDIPMNLPDSYVPGSAERMLLYRELDGLKTPEAVEQFRQRMLDRFGPIPEVGEELIRVVNLRRLGVRLGVRRLILKEGRMALFFDGKPDSPYYQGDAFGSIIACVMRNGERCRLVEKNDKRSLRVADIRTVREAVNFLEEIIG